VLWFVAYLLYAINTLGLLRWWQWPGSSPNALSLCLPFDCSSTFRPPRAVPAAAVFTADRAAAPTNVRAIILWGVSRLKDATAAHPPSHDPAPPSEGGGAGWRKFSRLPSKFMWMETAAADVLPSLTAAARSSCHQGSKGGVAQPFPEMPA